MLSGDTARQVEGRIALRPVDRVIVKGKSQAVEVFTPCENPEVTKLTEQAIRLFRDQKWDAAESCLRELLAIAPQMASPRSILNVSQHSVTRLRQRTGMVR